MVSTFLICTLVIAVIVVLTAIVLCSRKTIKNRWLLSIVGIISPISFVFMLVLLSEGNSVSSVGSVLTLERAIPKEMLIQMVGPNAAIVNALGVLSTLTFTSSFVFTIVIAMSFLLLIRIARKDSNSENIQYSFDSYQDSTNIKFDNFTSVTRLNI